MISFLIMITCVAMAVCAVIYFGNTRAQFKVTVIWLTLFGKQINSIHHSNYNLFPASIQLLLNFITFVNGVLCMYDFDRGLSELIAQSESPVLTKSGSKKRLTLE